MPAVLAHPAWKQAIVDYKAAGFKEGDIISFDWLYDHFSLPRPSNLSTIEEFKESQWKFRAEFEAFEKELLVTHLVALDNVKSVGYRIVPTTEQTRWAWREGMKEINKGMRRLGKRITFIDDTRLSPAQLKENNDAQARLASLSVMMNKTRRLPKP